MDIIAFSEYDISVLVEYDIITLVLHLKNPKQPENILLTGGFAICFHKTLNIQAPPAIL
jgi:hypothetical protein